MYVYMCKLCCVVLCRQENVRGGIYQSIEQSNRCKQASNNSDTTGKGGRTKNTTIMMMLQ